MYNDELTKKLADTAKHIMSGASIEEATGDKEAYQKFFNDTLKKYGVKSPAELSDEDKKKFFDEIDAGWEGDNEKKESTEELEEGKLSPSEKNELDELINRVYIASDPSNYDEDESVEDVIKIIRKKFGDKIADTVDSGTYVMHFGRPNNQGDRNFDDLAARYRRRITKAGKVNKQDVEKMKREIKAKLGIKESTEELEEGKIDLNKKVKNEKEFESYMDSFKGPDILAAVEQLDSGEKYQKGTVGFFLSQQMSMKEETLKLDARRREFREKIKQLAYEKAKQMIKDGEEEDQEDTSLDKDLTVDRTESVTTVRNIKK